MAYNGYLLRVGDYTIPEKYIGEGTYTISPNKRLDQDSYRDADGILKRNALRHTASAIEFETGSLYENEMDELMENIQRNFKNYYERNVDCSYYDPENRTYKTGEFYIPDIDFSIKGKNNGSLIYGPTKFSFVEY